MTNKDIILSLDKDDAVLIEKLLIARKNLLILACLLRRDINKFPKTLEKIKELINLDSLVFTEFLNKNKVAISNYFLQTKDAIAEVEILFNKENEEAGIF